MLLIVNIIIPEKDREFGAAQAEIKALRATEALKDKAIEEVVKTLNAKCICWTLI